MDSKTRAQPPSGDEHVAETLVRCIRGLRHALYSTELALADWLRERGGSNGPSKKEAPTTGEHKR